MTAEDKGARRIPDRHGIPVFARLGAFPDLYRGIEAGQLLRLLLWLDPRRSVFQRMAAGGFPAVGHIVWQKDYSSRTGFLQSCHEQAYLLVKSNPDRPAKPLADVQPWEYSGNRAHPTEKSVGVLTPVIQSRAISCWTRFQVRAVQPLPLRSQAAAISGLSLRSIVAAMPGRALPVLHAMQPERRRNMESSIKQAAILANLCALRATLAGALERATDAEDATRNGEVNQAISAVHGIESMLQDALALYTAALALHRSGRA